MPKNEILPWLRQRLPPTVIIAFVLGTLFGLVVLGWWVFPVQWVNADLADLRPAAQESVLQMVADSFAVTGNAAEAQSRLRAMQRNQDMAALRNTLDKLKQAALEKGDTNAANRIQQLTALLGQAPSSGGTAPDSGSAGWIWAGSANKAARYLGMLFFLILLGVGVFLLLQVLQRREVVRRSIRRPGIVTPEAAGVVRPFVATPPPADALALAHFEAAYHDSDESFDVSYSIESPSGEFLGECGLSAIESISPDGERRVPGLELWLFDKEDVRSEVKVLTNDAALKNQVTYQDLTAKGEPVLAEEGEIVELQTANLVLRATVVEAQVSGQDPTSYAKVRVALDVYRRGDIA